MYLVYMLDDADLHMTALLFSRGVGLILMWGLVGRLLSKVPESKRAPRSGPPEGPPEADMRMRAGITER